MGAQCVTDTCRSGQEIFTERETQKKQSQTELYQEEQSQINKEQGYSSDLLVKNKDLKKGNPQGQINDNIKADGEVITIEIMQCIQNRRNKMKAKILPPYDQDEVFENITRQEKVKSPFDYQLILNALGTNSIFNKILPTDWEKITENIFYCVVSDQQYVFKEGDRGSSYFLIERGQCQIIINGEVKKTLKASDSFGELALLYNAPRSASVKALGDCAFWAIDRKTFRNVVQETSLKELEENNLFIQNVKFFESLTTTQRELIGGMLITLIFKKGEIIVSEGDQADSFFIIKSGSVSVIKGGEELRKMVAGDSFGEMALFQNSGRSATVKAFDETVKCLALSRENLTRILGDKIQVIMYNNSQRWAIEKHPLLQKLTKLQIEKVIFSCSTVSYKKNDIVFKCNKICNKLIIVLEGSLIEHPSGKKIAEAGQIFGDIYLYNVTQNMMITEDIQFENDGLLSEISQEKFFQCIGGAIEQILKKNLNSYENKYMKKQDGNSKEDFSHLDLQGMISIKKLGAGQFGNVYLVKNLNDSKLYALKCISKSQIVAQRLEKHLQYEKKVLESANFPIIMQFKRSFRDNNFIYFLVEYIRGMKLFDVIRDIGLLNTVESQFYIGSLLLCVEYFHTNFIIYRDIKPENIMIDDMGFMKLIDMGTAKFLKGKSGRTYTIIGTPHYMAPEIMTGKGYTYSVDFWSIGVCLYEFMCGGVPYAEDADDPFEIYKEVIKKPLQFPTYMTDENSIKMMEQLMSKTPEIRLGSSFAMLKSNKWFNQLDWDKLMDRELSPPYIPPNKKIISEKEIEKQFQIGRTAAEEMQGQVENYNPQKAKNMDWDQEY